MKKVSLKDIESGRLKLAKADKDRLEQRKAQARIATAAGAAIDKLGALADKIDAAARAQAESSTRLISVLAEKKAPVMPEPVRAWTFDVKRNKAGFISKILASERRPPK